MLTVAITSEWLSQWTIPFSAMETYFVPNKQPPKQIAQDRAASGAFSCIAGDGRGTVVRQAKDIVGTGMVEAGKLNQHLGGDVPLAGLVIGIADLCTF